jgi:hypothetical protein
VNSYEQFELDFLSHIDKHASSQPLHYRLADLSAQFKIRPEHLPELLLRFARQQLIWIAAWDGSQERPWRQWRNPSDVFKQRTDNNHFRIKILPSGSARAEDLANLRAAAHVANLDRTQKPRNQEQQTPSVSAPPRQNRTIVDIIKEWRPAALSSELKYRDSLATFVRDRLPMARVETEYRHLGTTIDVYVKTSHFQDTEVFIELKLNLNRKTEFDRLIGQIESLQPKLHSVIIILCGKNSASLVGRLRERYSSEGFQVFVIESVITGADATKDATRPPWPKKVGEYSATSGDAIPRFPRTLSGYHSEEHKDFWGKPYATKGTVRIFHGVDWQGLPDFPNTMNGCANGVFMIRWRLSDPDVRVHSTARNSSTSGGTVATGAFGYMYATNCDQPLFKFAGTINNNESTLVDVFYELKFWQAAP